jgi:4'-phosphopantetheinyl transferase
VRDRTGPGCVYLWYTSTARLGRRGLAACEALLSPAERQEAQLIVSPGPRNEHVAGRAFLRLVLSCHEAVPPRGWVFARESRGRPFVTGPARCGLAFNLSHAGGLIVCAVSAAGLLGVDVEDLRRSAAMEKIARRFFAPSELRDLNGLPPSQRAARFYGLWTLREAYLKARSLGLALPLDEFEFSLETGRRIPRLLTLPALACDDPRRWDFRQLRLRPAHLVALAFERDGGSYRRLHIRRFRRLGEAAANAVASPDVCAATPPLRRAGTAAVFPAD